ncbi:MAG: bifunctional proline dehydrogenase/L-glutamate gamma-semialdehyde dehydrogenase PutA [Hellea sp.]|nr:bifunctional proline dehydrogenase/L-glutamate gamma-semialdehyde dehydrogenase PutA [Hellea sp.]
MNYWAEIDQIKYEPEAESAVDLPKLIGLTNAQQSEIDQTAIAYVRKARSQTKKKGLMETFLEEFGLSNNEGLALMCLAESLLRVPDNRTADKLIAEKISSGAWASHKGQSDSWLVNASTLGLMLTGKIVDVDETAQADVGTFMHNITRRLGEPVIRAAMMQAMRIMGEQFVVGRTIDAAIHRSEKLGLDKSIPGLCSFDMLGEGARTKSDAVRYYNAYLDAIEALNAARGGEKMEDARPERINGISVKLSALHAQYDVLHESSVMTELYPLLLNLCQEAARGDINLCLDAEEADRLVISLKLLDKLLTEPTLKDWQGLGLAVQAYQKRARIVCRKLIERAKKTNRRLMIRLVKGAYWDSEIKHSQIEAHPDYPVWTRKPTTDLSFLACARLLLDARPHVYPQFATHNAHTVAAIEAMAGDAGAGFEFQRLHGMGEALYRAVGPRRPVRIYAPVGAHEDLLPYLVRRLLENGANTSFVHRFLDDDELPEHVARSPFAFFTPARHDKIALPRDMFGKTRPNSTSIDIYQESNVMALEKRASNQFAIAAGPIVNGKISNSKGHAVFSPFDSQKVGTVREASGSDIATAHKSAVKAQIKWNDLGGSGRAKILRKCADALEGKMEEFVTLMALEAGKCFSDSINEVREAVDFIRYYAAQASSEFDKGQRLPGPAGETNDLYLMGRGVFVCISPWNFPLAIFTGQVMAALAAGNTVLAKPAEQTPLTAFMAVQLFIKAGLPKNVLHLLPGSGEIVGDQLVKFPDIAGVCFTGSTDVAKIINRNLAAKDGAIPILVAETGGLNGMFVDTTALREQVLDDVVASAFNAAGQRCSALRILFLPEETADHMIEGIKGAMDCLHIGNPAARETDVGPVIDAEALNGLQDYVGNLPQSMRLLKQCHLPSFCDDGFFMAPTLIEANSLKHINKEQFGPILHVIRYKHKNLEKLAKEFAGKGFGLTLGVHSRLESFAEKIRKAVPAGNIYINRNIIGAVVGVQPFGGLGLSGTGPKAGGPHYLHRFAAEVTITNNITAQGGDPALLNLGE